MQLLVKEFVKLLQKEKAMTKQNIKDLEKQRAEFAYDCVEKVANEYGKDSKTANEYKSYVKKIPTLIQTNGLSATFAFMYSKKKTYEVIYKQVQKWLEERDFKINKELVKWIISQPSSEYRHITNEVMALFMWLRRFAEGMIEKEKGSKDGKEKEE